MAAKYEPKFNIGQVVVLKNSTDKIPTRILKAHVMHKTWFYEIIYHSGYYNQSCFRPLTKREKG